MLVEAIRKLKLQQDANFMSKQTYEEFIDDPFGEKRRMRRAAKLDDQIKNEIYENKVRFKKTKDLAVEIGLDAGEGHFGRRNEFQDDRRFQALFNRQK